jgi:hypothetical protein
MCLTVGYCRSDSAHSAESSNNVERRKLKQMIIILYAPSFQGYILSYPLQDLQAELRVRVIRILSTTSLARTCQVVAVKPYRNLLLDP